MIYDLGLSYSAPWHRKIPVHIGKRMTVALIQQTVASFYEISEAEMRSARRSRRVARPRQIAMYLARELTSQSLPDIGRRFNRDHTTVIHALKTIDRLCHFNGDMAEEIDHLRLRLSA